MWWAVVGSIVVYGLMVVLPLALEYKAGKEKERECNEQLKNGNPMVNIEKRSGIIMKSGEFIYAKTHTEFLNKAFGTNYKAWMRCTWTYNNMVVWMVRFNKTDGGFKNTFISNDRIKEECLGWDENVLTSVDKVKIVMEIDDNAFLRKYIFRGIYKYDEKNSNPHTVRYYDKIADEL